MRRVTGVTDITVPECRSQSIWGKENPWLLMPWLYFTLNPKYLRMLGNVFNQKNMLANAFCCMLAHTSPTYKTTMHDYRSSIVAN